MKKRETKAQTAYKKGRAALMFKHRREHRKKTFQEALEKGEVSTYYDVCGVFNGLSAAAKDSAVYREILSLARCGKTAQEIVNWMEPKE